MKIDGTGASTFMWVITRQGWKIEPWLKGNAFLALPTKSSVVKKKRGPDPRRRFIHKPIDGVREPGMAFGAEWVSRGFTIELLCIVMHSS